MQQTTNVLHQKEHLHGLHTLVRTGMPDEFVSYVLSLTRAFGITLAIRMGQTPVFNDTSFFRKPAFIKSKTGNWGLTKGVITVDAALGPYNSQGNPINAGHKKPRGIAAIPYTLTLPAVFSCIASRSNEFCVQHTRDNAYLIHCNSPGKQPVLFRIRSPHETSLATLEYQPSSNNIFKPVDIFGISNGNQLKAIISDHDMVWISRPSSRNSHIRQALQKGLPINNVFDTRKSHERLQLKSVLTHFCSNTQHALPSVNDANITSLGYVTPFEAYILLTLNAAYARITNHSNDLFQHGAANRYHSTTSSLAVNNNSTIIHINHHGIEMTHSQNELMHYACRHQQHFAIDFHPEWNSTHKKAIDFI